MTYGELKYFVAELLDKKSKNVQIQSFLFFSKSFLPSISSIPKKNGCAISAQPFIPYYNYSSA